MSHELQQLLRLDMDGGGREKERNGQAMCIFVERSSRNNNPGNYVISNGMDRYDDCIEIIEVESRPSESVKERKPEVKVEQKQKETLQERRAKSMNGKERETLTLVKTKPKLNYKDEPLGLEPKGKDKKKRKNRLKDRIWKGISFVMSCLI